MVELETGRFPVDVATGQLTADHNRKSTGPSDVAGPAGRVPVSLPAGSVRDRPLFWSARPAPARPTKSNGRPARPIFYIYIPKIQIFISFADSPPTATQIEAHFLDFGKIL